MRNFLLFLGVFLLAAQIADCQTVIYSQEEFKLKATICKPVGNGPFPAVIYHHGGLGNIVGGAPEETCDALADKGFVGFSPIRRPTKSLKGHMDDIMAAAAYIKTLDYVDQNRIGIMGFSRGALLAYKAISRQNDYKAAVIMGPAMGRNGKALKGKLVSNVNIPVLLLVAQNDTGSRTTMEMNTLKGTKKLHKAFKKKDKEAHLIIYPPYQKDGHTLFFKLGDYFKDVTAFFDKHL